MSLATSCRIVLDNWPAFHGPARILAAEDPPLRLECELAALDRLGCEFNSFTVHDASLAAATVDVLKRLAAELAGRLTYLLEPIRPIEVDQQGCVVQLRSLPPQQGDGKTTYYELLVRPGALSLSRYEKQADQGRRAIGAQVTREVLLRLVDDFCAVRP